MNGQLEIKSVSYSSFSSFSRHFYHSQSISNVITGRGLVRLWTLGTEPYTPYSAILPSVIYYQHYSIVMHSTSGIISTIAIVYTDHGPNDNNVQT